MGNSLGEAGRGIGTPLEIVFSALGIGDCRWFGIFGSLGVGAVQDVGSVDGGVETGLVVGSGEWPDVGGEVAPEAPVTCVRVPEEGVFDQGVADRIGKFFGGRENKAAHVVPTVRGVEDANCLGWSGGVGKAQLDQEESGRWSVVERDARDERR